MVKKFSIRFPSEMEQSFRDANRPLLTFLCFKNWKKRLRWVCVSGVHVWNIFAVFSLLPKNFFIHSNVIGSAFAIGKTIKFLVKSAEKCLDKCFGATSESDGLSLTSDQSQLHQNLSNCFSFSPQKLSSSAGPSDCRAAPAFWRNGVRRKMKKCRIQIDSGNCESNIVTASRHVTSPALNIFRHKS